MKTKCLAVLVLASLAACGPGNMRAPIPTPSPAPTLPDGSQSVEADFYMGTLTLAQAQASTPYLTVCGTVAGGRVAFPNIPAQPGPNTLVSRAFNGPCNGDIASGTVLAAGYGTGTIVAGAANDLTAVFGTGATTLTPVP